MTAIATHATDPNSKLHALLPIGATGSAFLSMLGIVSLLGSAGMIG